MRGLAGLTLADYDPESSDHSSGQTKRARESLDSLSSSTNLSKKRGRHNVAYGKQGGRAKEMIAASSSSTSYAGAVKASNRKLTITRKESEGNGGMDNMDLCEIQSAITKMILRADPGFLVCIEHTFIFEDKVLMICKDENSAVPTGEPGGRAPLTTFCAPISVFSEYGFGTSEIAGKNNSVSC